MLLISLITAVQVILIIKIWMMTGDVRKIRQKLNEPQAENRKITEAQLKVLEGKTEEAYTLYTSNPQLSSSASFLRLNVLSSLN